LAERFGGEKLTIGLKYDLKTGEDPNNIVIWHLNTNRTIERFDCTYLNGYVFNIWVNSIHYFLKYP